MPSSVRDGTRPRAARIRSYSSAVMLCWASNCGVTETGSGTTAEETFVIAVNSIVARRLPVGVPPECAVEDLNILALFQSHIGFRVSRQDQAAQYRRKKRCDKN